MTKEPSVVWIYEKTVVSDKDKKKGGLPAYTADKFIPYVPQQYLNVSEAETEYFEKERDTALTTLQELEATNKKLREALEKIATPSDMVVPVAVRKIAKEALGGPND